MRQSQANRDGQQRESCREGDPHLAHQSRRRPRMRSRNEQNTMRRCRQASRKLARALRWLVWAGAVSAMVLAISMPRIGFWRSRLLHAQGERQARASEYRTRISIAIATGVQLAHWTGCARSRRGLVAPGLFARLTVQLP